MSECKTCQNQDGVELTRGQYLGSVLASQTTDQCNVSMVKHHAPRVLPEHAHDWPFICTLLSGSYVSRTTASEMEFQRGKAVFHPSSFQHQDEIGLGGGSFFCTQLNPSLFVDADTRSRQAHRDISPIDVPQAHILLGELFCATLFGADALTFDAISAELAGTLFCTQCDGSDTSPRWILDLGDRLREVEDDNLTLATLAQDAGVHSTTVTRLFRKHWGCSIGTYRAQVRSSKAYYATVATSEPLSSISLTVGYADQSHMTREFVRWFGQSPAKLRRHARLYIHSAPKRTAPPQSLMTTPIGS